MTARAKGQGEYGDVAFVERASMVSSFTTIKRTVGAGLFTAGIVVGGLLATGGAPVAATVAVVSLLVVTRLVALWTANEGLKAVDIGEQRRWTRRLELALMPMGAASGFAPSFVPTPDGAVPPQWWGLLVCAMAVTAANVLLGYGRSRTFLALALPLLAGTVFSIVLVGGFIALMFTPGALVVGAVIVLDNREAGAIFREARWYQERNAALVAELRDANARLDERVHTDSLTGLSNRAGLRRHVEEHESGDGAMEVIYVDLDGFKSINDDFGHAAGDAVLSTIGERLGRIVRSSDCAARLGGDEFVVLATADVDSEISLVSRIRTALEQPIAYGELSLDVGVSLGSRRREPGDDLGLVMRMADAAMYEQKRLRRHEAAELAS